MIERTSELQNAFHSDITTYINSGILSRSDLYFSVFVLPVAFVRHAKALIQKYRLLSSEISTVAATDLHVRTESYEGQNQYVRRMMSFLSEHLKEDLIGAYVHGSLGTYEDIAYSDFDALVVLKSEVFESPKRLAISVKKLNHARTIMLDFDPLQHHGWFVLTELDLKFYCNAYFPVELFKYAKSLFDDRELELEIAMRESSSEARTAFEKMANAIISKITNHRYPTNVYQLKGLLSQFMLLPALYLQAKNGCGIYKKESFALARADFDSADWAIMDEVSKIRMNWNYEISAFKKRLISHPHFLSRYFAKRLAPEISKSISNALTAQFYSEMGKLVFLMKEKLA